jgi:hypothetical protein
LYNLRAPMRSGFRRGLVYYSGGKEELREVVHRGVARGECYDGGNRAGGVDPAEEGRAW